MSLRVYDPKDVFIVFGPAGSLRGFVSGTFIGVSKKSNAYASFAGVDGEYARSRNSDQGAFITVSLMQDSASNVALSIAHIADLEAGAGVFPLLIKDDSGNSIYEASKAWIVKFPDANYGKTAEGRDWMFETDRLISFEGKNFLA